MFVYNDIEESDYKLELYDMTFYFSSEFNKSRFYKGVKDYIKSEEDKLKARYNIYNIDFKEYFSIVYYNKIEKRGFRVYLNEEEKYINMDDNITAII